MKTPLRLIAALIIASTALPVIADGPPDAERKELEEWAKSLDKATVHRLVLAHELNPLGPDSVKARRVLSLHFEAVDYDVCMDQIRTLLDEKTDAHDAVFWQVVFGSGDFVEQHPGQAKDKFAYMVAGLESGIRAYTHVLRDKPKAHHPLMDKLVALKKENRLLEFVKEHPCDKK